MDSEQFYDSLDEDDSTTISGATIESKKRVPVKEIEKVEITSLVPLYQRETHKQNIKRVNYKVKKRVQYIAPSKTDVTLVRRRQKKVVAEKSKRTDSKCSFFSNSSLSSVLEVKPKRTYLDIFHKKIGYVQGTPGNDTTRGLKGDDTFRSAVSTLSDGTEFSDAVSFVSDSSSFYVNFMEEEKRKKSEETITDGVSSLSMSDSKFNLKSVSEYSLKSSSNGAKSVGAKRSNASFKITKFNKSVVEVPALGRLGPDPEAIREKMEKLKRQQSYGQKVSNANRLRMLEMQVIKNFNQEMKKSSDINKSAKNIIIA